MIASDGLDQFRGIADKNDFSSSGIKSLVIIAVFISWVGLLSEDAPCATEARVHGCDNCENFTWSFDVVSTVGLWCHKIPAQNLMIVRKKHINM